MPEKSLLERLEDYKKEDPNLLKILEQLNIDEKSYLNALCDLLEQEIIYLPPLSNSSYLENDRSL